MEQHDKYFDLAPVAMMLVKGSALTVALANRRFLDHFDIGTEKLIGKPLLDIIPEFSGNRFDSLLRSVMSTGEPASVHGLPYTIKRGGKKVNVFISSNCDPFFEDDGHVSGVIIVLRDVTSEVRSREQLVSSEARFRSLIEEAPVATCLFTGPEMRVEIINAMMVKNWGKDFSVLNKPLIEALPELEGQPFLDILANVYTTGTTYSAKAARVDLVVDGVLGIYYYDFTYKPLLDENGAVYGIINVSINVTQEVVGRQMLEESETKLRGIISSAPAGIGLFVGRDLVIENPNQTFIDIVGKGPHIEGMMLKDAMPELITEGQPFLKILDEVFTSGVMFQSFGSQVKIVQNGVMSYNYYNISYTPIFDKDGEVYAILDIAIDVTKQIQAQQKLEETELYLRGAIELAELGTWSIDAGTQELVYSERIMNWYGVDPGEAGLDGVFDIVLEQDRARIAEAVKQAFNAGSAGRFDEKYTIFNKVTGKQRFIHAMAKVICDEDQKPVRLYGTAQDITLQQQTQIALEQEVQLRTEELASAIEELRSTNEELARTNEELEQTNLQLVHSNDELAQYAYVASHDLQEPLRKIRFFSDVLSRQQDIDEESQVIVGKITYSAKRMSQLILDLLNFSRLLKAETLMQPVDLTSVFQAVVNDFELTIEEKQAVITAGELPTVQAINLQISQLFFNLLSNALKFVKPGVHPQVSVESSPLPMDEVRKFIPRPKEQATYYMISFTDNGIGFESEYSEQIFEVFKRLHGRDAYPGSGIGLSLCRRILSNHNGVLFAESRPGIGTVFQIIIPDRQGE